MNETRIGWDLLQAFQAVAETGSLTAAGRRLGLSQPTIGRRVAALEAQLGERLFDRRQDGLRLTRAGGALHPIAESMGAEARALERAWPASPSRLYGTVRIAVGEWGGRFLMQSVGTLVANMPDVQIEIVPSFGFLNLSRREADIALRNVLPESGDLITRLVARPSRAVYAARALLRDHPEATSEQRYRTCPWVGYDDTHHHLRSATWLEARRQGSKPHVRCASSLILLEAVKAGAGLGLLPCYAADPEPNLVRVSGTIDELQGQIWLVYHADSRNRPAVMTLVDRLDALFAHHGRLTVDHPDP